MSISNNAIGLNMTRQAMINNLRVQHSIQQLSSGYRINSAADDAAGLAISEKMRAQQTVMERAMANTQDGISMTKVADGAMSEMNTMLNRLTDLSMQASNGIYDDNQRSILNNEAQSILQEIDRIAQSSNFNGQKLLDGSQATEQQLGIEGLSSERIADSVFVNQSDMTAFDGSNGSDAFFKVGGEQFAVLDANAGNFDTLSAQLADQGVTAIALDGTDDLTNIANTINATAGTNFTVGTGGIAMEVSEGIRLQVGTDGSESSVVTVGIGDMTSKALGLGSLDLSTQRGAMDALKSISSAIERVSANRGSVGATQNRLEHTYNNLNVGYENITAAESRLRDADIAKTLLNQTRSNILGQAGISMMVHNNMQQYQMLNLLR